MRSLVFFPLPTLLPSASYVLSSLSKSGTLHQD
jgi:hypothetical protein